ncbi:MAG: hypothetical protein IJI36_14035 [Kiritimatiellae bacterium]|nr:hypothetical protein [Kiritimatiellia bacterium]
MKTTKKSKKDKKRKETKDEGSLYYPIALGGVFGFCTPYDVNIYVASCSFHAHHEV